ncbi:hypothetical protein [Alistipes indistinctus]
MKQTITPDDKTVARHSCGRLAGQGGDGNESSPGDNTSRLRR